jgi:RimJ/RimL family protein N-acetyltransferase
VKVTGICFDSFSTDRLLAERLTPSHMPDVIRMNTDPDVMAHLGGVRDADWSAEYMERNLRHWDQHGFGIWMLRERAGSEIIGRAVLRYLPVDGVDEIEVGYAFLPHVWGRGLATEVTATCLRIARDDMRLHEIVAITMPANVASQRVLIKNGLTYDRDVLHDGTMWCLFRRRWEQ